MFGSGFLKKNTVTRESLAKSIKRESGIPINRAISLIDQAIDLIIDAIRDGKIVKIRMFGTFTTKQKNARLGRNPRTMEEAEIPARTVIKFKVAPTLKKRINSNIV